MLSALATAIHAQALQEGVLPTQQAARTNQASRFTATNTFTNTVVPILLEEITEKNNPHPPPRPTAPRPYTYTTFLYNLQTNKSTYLKGLADEPGIDPAERYYVAGKILNSPTLLCKAARQYEQRTPQTPLENAFIQETLAELNCDNQRNTHLLRAAASWQQLGVQWRADIIKALANNTPPNLTFKPATINPDTTALAQQLAGATSILIGDDSILVTKNDRIMSQADRTVRDWLSYRVYNPFNTSRWAEPLTTFSERLVYNTTDLRPDIGWHEGARIKEIIHLSDATFIPALTALAARKNGTWYASDEKGRFSFPIPEDKLTYPTVRFLTQDLAVIVDTHGINMLVSEAFRNNASLVYADCDHPGKIAAANYLEKAGIRVACTVDRFTYLLLGHKTKIIGNPPITATPAGALLGSRPLTLHQNETIIVMNATTFYYDTPTKYFTTLEKSFPLKTQYVTITAPGQTSKLVLAAKKYNASSIAGRIFHQSDYAPLVAWLDENPRHKLILFHTYPYPYGKLLADSYPRQTTFDDPTPEPASPDTKRH
ncbi:hypothetical protein D6783_04725 [Candidatus Woesearchaeota archaeon]|nr:MAG: hypothetical protein D6783_04725 [Candidatus Woesearchaeota archaeon]